MSAALICPLLSSGKDIDMICLKERCAWFLSGASVCSMYVTAYNASLDIKEKQALMHRPQQ